MRFLGLGFGVAFVGLGGLGGFACLVGFACVVGFACFVGFGGFAGFSNNSFNPPINLPSLNIIGKWIYGITVYCLIKL
jgi:hypothetical protein